MSLKPDDKPPPNPRTVQDILLTIEADIAHPTVEQHDELRAMGIDDSTFRHYYAVAARELAVFEDMLRTRLGDEEDPIDIARMAARGFLAQALATARATYVEAEATMKAIETLEARIAKAEKRGPKRAWEDNPAADRRCAVHEGRLNGLREALLVLTAEKAR
jgi:hypothetical protein